MMEEKLPHSEYRNLTLDYYKFIGMLLIFLAHTSISTVVQNIRCFDVTLLVFASGISYRLSINRHRSFWTYIIQRVKKIVFPTWVMITIALICRLILSKSIQALSFYEVKHIPFIYLFVVDIGFYWIAGIFFLISVVLPLISKLNEHTYGSLFVFLFAVFMIGAGAIFSYCGGGYYFVNSVCSAFFYVAAGILGYFFQDNKEKRPLMMIISTALFIAISLYTAQFAPALHKNPPDLYYFFYGISVSTMLYIVLDILPLEKHGCDNNTGIGNGGLFMQENSHIGDRHAWGYRNGFYRNSKAHRCFFRTERRDHTDRGFYDDAGRGCIPERSGFRNGQGYEKSWEQ